jgi:hypothetical protein
MMREHHLRRHRSRNLPVPTAEHALDPPTTALFVHPQPLAGDRHRLSSVRPDQLERRLRGDADPSGQVLGDRGHQRLRPPAPRRHRGRSGGAAGHTRRPRIRWMRGHGSTDACRLRDGSECQRGHMSCGLTGRRHTVPRHRTSLRPRQTGGEECLKTRWTLQRLLGTELDSLGLPIRLSGTVIRRLCRGANGRERPSFRVHPHHRTADPNLRRGLSPSSRP